MNVLVVVASWTSGPRQGANELTRLQLSNGEAWIITNDMSLKSLALVWYAIGQTPIPTVKVFVLVSKSSAVPGFWATATPNSQVAEGMQFGHPHSWRPLASNVGALMIGK